MIYNILQYLETCADVYSSKVALEDGSEAATYEEYMIFAKKIGTFIAQKTDLRNRPVAVLADRNIKSVISFMGVVYSGNFYVPIDPSMPAERIALIMNDLHPLMTIDARIKKDGFEDAYDADKIISEQEIDNERLDLIRSNMTDTDPLYAVFTSGSTGVPKGVVKSHRALIDMTEVFHDTFGFDNEMVFGNQAPFDFDVSAKDIYNSMRNGGTIQILAKKLFKMPKLLMSYISEKKINTMIWAVSALRIISDFKALDNVECPDLRYVMFSGEVMPVKSVRYWREKVPSARYVNLYAPSEITYNCTYYEITEDLKDDEMLPIGKAFRNCRVTLRDSERKTVNDPNVTGEICVSGTCLAMGYWNNKEQTDKVFTDDPEITEYHSRMYCTGDLGFYNEAGELVFVSRQDYQIKHMGHRIELGEIEVALNSISFIDIGCCLYDRINEKIVCFYQAESECKKEIVLELSKKLPKYMWPNVYKHYTELPTNRTGKIDRKFLSDLLKPVKN